MMPEPNLLKTILSTKTSHISYGGPYSYADPNPRPQIRRDQSEFKPPHIDVVKR